MICGGGVVLRRHVTGSLLRVQLTGPCLAVQVRTGSGPGRRGPRSAGEMERWRGRVALVTGASVGIGAAIAAELVRSGVKVVGCA